jgi:pSer/pThr/pTyr-binding forkhead associated (FHA) protein
MPQLLIQGNSGNTIVHDLHAGVNTIGRGSTCDIILYDDGVSGRHAEILCGVETYKVQDLDSSNGTQVNGRRIMDSDLRDGDIVSFGPVKCAFIVSRRAVVEPMEEPIMPEPAPEPPAGLVGSALSALGRLFGGSKGK